MGLKVHPGVGTECGTDIETPSGTLSSRLVRWGSKDCISLTFHYLYTIKLGDSNTVKQYTVIR